jgi:hypothetical protein
MKPTVSIYKMPPVLKELERLLASTMNCSI